MDDDFGTPEAVAVLFDLAGEVNRSKSAAAAGLLFALGDAPGLALTADALLVGSCALLFAAAVVAVAVGHGLRVFVAGGTLGLAGLIGALLQIPLPGPRLPHGRIAAAGCSGMASCSSPL